MNLTKSKHLQRLNNIQLINYQHKCYSTYILLWSPCGCKHAQREVNPRVYFATLEITSKKPIVAQMFYDKKCNFSKCMKVILFILYLNAVLQRCNYI